MFGLGFAKGAEEQDLSYWDVFRGFATTGCRTADVLKTYDC